MEELPENPQTVGEWLKYHRILNNYTKIELSEKLNMYRKTIENIEYDNYFPSRKNSEKLAKFFKLDTKYFYDEFYESSVEISSILKKHRKNNNYTLKEIQEIYNIRSCSWNDWELGKKGLNRKTYERLKKLGIL